jgi:hypothetical protein
MSPRRATAEDHNSRSDQKTRANAVLIIIVVNFVGDIFVDGNTVCAMSLSSVITFLVLFSGFTDHSNKGLNFE